MDRIRITKEFTFEMAHALEGHRGLCANIHGHSYHLSVTLIGTPIQEDGHPSLGMVMDFADLKKIVHEEIIETFDHALVLKDTHLPEVQPGLSQVKAVRTPYQPTCENLLVDFAARIRRHLPAAVALHSLCLRETGTAYAAWFAADNA